ncbi:hypothetical protein KVH15_33620 [Streptomyces olivaceus]|uniref:hypothetical protein n=1 Tax=Streptomyces olivaceus TaxID=47716 RepID=UPI001CCBE4FA|nr:hypothetical protein [Streptomyces olivaceus]MBZ6085924.1 hypothetical protein [Streptomyces olivaceus]GHI91751.1 hypothetical protein TPA0905_12220 [Streptomyces olivaceus]
MTAYARARGVPIQCDPCPDLAAAVGDMPYLDPVTDEAPWYDPAVPESRGVLGVMGLSVAGFDSSPITREPVQLVGPGAVLGPLRRQHRELAYTVLLIATEDCALSYGLEWLSVALQGSACAGCAGDEMCVFSCCPTDGDRELRHLYDVGVLDGPQVTGTQYLADGTVLATVTFSLAAGKPWIYREPLVTGMDWVPIGTGDLVGPVDPDQVYQQCLTAEPCTQDPLCPPPPLPPLPPAPTSPCYPTGVDLFRRSRVSVSPLEQSSWLETVPVLEVRTGSQDMRRLLVRFWTNPQGGTCEGPLDPCAACTDVNIAYLPAGSTLRVDGRVQRAVVECPQIPIGVATSTPTLYGPEGSLFGWPQFTCPTGLCIEVWSRSADTAPDATARVLLVPRSDVG